jgi:hypothetical protein
VGAGDSPVLAEQSQILFSLLTFSGLGNLRNN